MYRIDFFCGWFHVKWHVQYLLTCHATAKAPLTQWENVSKTFESIHYPSQSYFRSLGVKAFRTRPFRRTRTRTQTEVRNSDSDSDLRNRDFPTPWPKIISQWNTYDVLTILDVVYVVYKGNNRILRKKKLKFGNFFVKCWLLRVFKMCKQTRW
jgi:hypothetical protein